MDQVYIDSDEEELELEEKAKCKKKVIVKVYPGKRDRVLSISCPLVKL